MRAVRKTSGWAGDARGQEQRLIGGALDPPGMPGLHHCGCDGVFRALIARGEKKVRC